jgi:hypothetical protein
MAAAGDAEQEKELLSSVVGDIRSYSGSDPLRPWLRYGTTTHPPIHPPLPPFHFSRSIDRSIRRPSLARGMRKMERALPPPTLREKLPRFLQKCAQEFQGDPRCRGDPRYLRVWIQLVTDLARLLRPAAVRPDPLPPLALLLPNALCS